MNSGNKKSLKRATTSIVVGTLGVLAQSNANASQLMAFKPLGTGAELRTDLVVHYDNNSSTKGGTYGSDHATTEDKSGEAKCGEGKCGGENPDTKSTPTGTDKKASEAKCGEGKCG